MLLCVATAQALTIPSLTSRLAAAPPALTCLEQLQASLSQGAATTAAVGATCLALSLAMPESVCAAMISQEAALASTSTPKAAPKAQDTASVQAELAAIQASRKAAEAELKAAKQAVPPTPTPAATPAPTLSRGGAGAAKQAARTVDAPCTRRAHIMHYAVHAPSAHVHMHLPSRQSMHSKQAAAVARRTEPRAAAAPKAIAAPNKASAEAAPAPAPAAAPAAASTGKEASRKAAAEKQAAERR